MKSNVFDKWLNSLWALIIAIPLIYFPAPGALAGHPWKVELAASLFLFSAAAGFFFYGQKDRLNFSFDRQVLLWIFAPLGFFVVWSAFSLVWADSTESVLHHTLVWAVYLVFFVFAAQITVRRRTLKTALFSISLVVGAIAVQCIVEHTLAAQVSEIFGTRFSRYAEIMAALAPLFLAFILRLKGKHLWWSAFLGAAVWLAVLFSLSRTAFISAIGGIGVFAALRLFSKTDFSEKRRLAAAIFVLVLIVFAVNISDRISGSQKSSTLTRLSDDSAIDIQNSLGQNIRFLYAGVGLEMFEKNPAVGVGADNFGLEFNKYRAVFSADAKNKSVAEQQDILIPERAHNEYLQILAELGIVGGLAFSCFIFGIAKLFFAQINFGRRVRQVRADILTHAAFAGIVAFLFNSAFSSYSFRLMQNGIVFFFLLALFLRKYFSLDSSKSAAVFAAPRFKMNLAVASAILCLSLLTLSALKASSQYLVYLAENEQDSQAAQNYYERAMRLDPANASANQSFGLRLLAEGKYADSAAQQRIGIDKGLNTSLCYSTLAAAEILSGDNPAAEKTLSEAVEIFPFSYFLQVRYASVLQNLGENAQAEKHFQIAENLNQQQAEVWRLLINEGARAANKSSFEDVKRVGLKNLYPDQAVPIILTERQTLHPEEIEKIALHH